MINNSHLYYDSKDYLAYNKYCTKKNNKFGLIFLGGFKSDMHGTKAIAIADYAARQDFDLIRFDYAGHGESSGEFIDGTISLWLKNTLQVIDELANDKPQILIGSSMGGWIMLLAALARPARIIGLIGLAPAPDFTEELIWNCMTDRQKIAIQADGQIDFNNEFCEDAYPISHKLILDGRKNLLLNDSIPLNIPIRLIHGMNDQDVPFETSIQLAQKLTSQDVKLQLIKSADHRLSKPDELEAIYALIDELL